MYIHEAVAEAVRIDGYIARHECSVVRIKPTNSADGCILTAEGRAPCTRWQPWAKDLMADDWVVAK